MYERDKRKRIIKGAPIANVLSDRSPIETFEPSHGLHPFPRTFLFKTPLFLSSQIFHKFTKDLMLCKSILSEYTVKMSLKRPMYTTKQHEGSVPIFQSTLVFDGVVYTGDISRSKKEAEQLAARAAILSLHDAGNPKSQKTLAEIIASKVRLHAMMQKVKDSHPSQIQPKYMPDNTVEHVTTTVNEDKEVNGAILDNVVACGAISEICPTTSHLGPEFRSIKPVASSPSERLPIESVPSTSEEPVGDRATGSKKRSKNKRKARKKLCMENQVATGTSQTAPCSIAQ
ncbi:Double-stranded RNA-binding protein 4, partial [Cucurbita argyrosperma subsp. argyrosperma]